MGLDYSTEISVFSSLSLDHAIPSEFSIAANDPGRAGDQAEVK
ncbi:hypothetical protein CCACVL1_05166, partial [Corchorus capsularis]